MLDTNEQCAHEVLIKNARCHIFNGVISTGWYTSVTMGVWISYHSLRILESKRYLYVSNTAKYLFWARLQQVFQQVDVEYAK